MKAKYELDPTHSKASFSIKHMMIAKVHGAFEALSGTLEYDPQDLSKSSVETIIQTNSINTGVVDRDNHLKSADFFDIEKFPTIMFKSTKIQKGTGDELKVLGDLTIHGVTKEVTLDVDGPSQEVKDPWGNIKVAASGTTKIKRKDFGLTWNTALEAGGVLVGDDVNITLEVQFTKVA